MNQVFCVLQLDLYENVSWRCDFVRSASHSIPLHTPNYASCIMPGLIFGPLNTPL